jgi:sialic acid synthase SpsE
VKAVPIGKRMVGDGQPCYVIAEAGSNHNRDLDTATALIAAAARAGADAVKFQTYTGRSLYSTRTPAFDYLGELAAKPVHELLEECALPRQWQPILATQCRDAGVEFLASPFDRQAVDELDALDVAAFKVASFEIVDLGLLEHIGKCRRPVILSTGMASLGEIEEAVDALTSAGALDVCLLQCASVYPAPVDALNLASIKTLKAAFGVPVGFSDHSLGIHIPPAAVAIGANLIEKHITLDRSHPGPDHAFAIQPDELIAMVSHIRDVERALGDGQKHGPTTAEAEEMYAKARRSIVAARPIPTGTVITDDMLTVKRPGFGIKPRDRHAVVGRRAARDIAEDEVITWDLV